MDGRVRVSLSQQSLDLSDILKSSAGSYSGNTREITRGGRPFGFLQMGNKLKSGLDEQN